MCRTLMLIGFRGWFRKLSTNRWMQSSARSLLKRFWEYYLKIFWCTRLARAEGEDERKRIEEEMLHVGLASIVDQLHATRASAKERQQNLERGIREEARKLKSSGGDGDMARRGLVGRDGDNGWWNN